MGIKQQRANSRATKTDWEALEKEERSMYKTGFAIETVRHIQNLLNPIESDEHVYEVIAHELKVLSTEYDVYCSRYRELSKFVIKDLQFEISEFEKEKKEIEDGV